MLKKMHSHKHIHKDLLVLLVLDTLLVEKFLRLQQQYKDLIIVMIQQHHYQEEILHNRDIIMVSRLVALHMVMLWVDILLLYQNQMVIYHQ